jgi:hypothetical protein
MDRPHWVTSASVGQGEQKAMVESKKTGSHEQKDAERNEPIGHFIIYDRTVSEEDSETEDCEDCGDSDPVILLGRVVHRVAHAERAFIQRYMQCHEESNARRDGGWFFDFEENLYRAFRTGSRNLKLRKVVGL